MNLDVSKGPGPDKIPAICLKNIAMSICEPLQKIFMLCLEKGAFPKFWKQSFITAIFKSGSRSEIKNYRGISILSAIPKLYEKMVCDKLTPQFAGIIDKSQHGFVKGKSTETNTLLFVNFLVNSLE